MDQNTELKIKMLREGAKKQLEAAKEAVCEVCHRPYIETDQTAMDEQCESCRVMTALDQQWEQAFAVGRAIGMIEVAVMVAEASEQVQTELAMRSRREWYKL